MQKLREKKGQELKCWKSQLGLRDIILEKIEELMQSDISYGEFSLQAPMLNPNRKKITGTICGVRIENIEEPLMQEIRYLDKMVDELAKGKSLDKILR